MYLASVLKVSIVKRIFQNMLYRGEVNLSSNSELWLLYQKVWYNDHSNENKKPARLSLGWLRFFCCVLGMGIIGGDVKLGSRETRREAVRLRVLALLA